MASADTTAVAKPSLLSTLASDRVRPVLLAYVVALVLFGVTVALSPAILESQNISVLLLGAAFIGIAALGQTFVVIGAGIDLSVPWTMTMAAIVCARLTNGDDGALIWVLPVVLLIAAAAGLLNGIGVAYVGVSPIVMTLGVSGLVQGGVLLYTQGTGSPGTPQLLIDLSVNSFGPFRWAIWIWIVLAVIGAVVLGRSVFGRQLYAVGTNSVVTEFSGIRVRPILVATYVISAITGAIAGMLLSGFAEQSYLSIGNPYLFASIAAVAIGGTSILGGSGSYLGTIGGALILAVLATLLPIMHLSQAALPIVYGAVILIAIALAAGQGRRGV